MMFINFRAQKKGNHLSLIFPGWKPAERVAFFSPHDDDVVLGAGYLLLATLQQGGFPHIFIFCRGDAGYSKLAQKKGIVTRRRREAVQAYAELGVAEANIHFFDIPDFSLMAHLDRMSHAGKKGLFEPLLRKLRQEKFSRVVFSNGSCEHWDHTATFFLGIYTSPQAQDFILVDLGQPSPIQSYLAYSVWADFEPGEKNHDNLSADVGILASAEEEEKVQTAIRAFSSQERIIQDILARRAKRKFKGRYLELYKNYQARKPVDYQPYFRVLKKIFY